MSRWDDATVTRIGKAVERTTCQLCGGRVKTIRRYLGNGYWQSRDQCAGCGAGVLDSESVDHEDA